MSQPPTIGPWPLVAGNGVGRVVASNSLDILSFRLAGSVVLISTSRGAPVVFDVCEIIVVDNCKSIHAK